MPAARKPAAKAEPSGVFATVPLSYEGQRLPMDQDLRDVLPEHVLEACLARGEAEHR